MKVSRVGGAFVAALLLLVALAAAQHRHALGAFARQFGFTAALRPVAVGQILGGVNVSTLQGQPIRLHARAGRAMLVNVFATWCPSCQAEMPMLTAQAPKLAAAGIDVVGIDQAESATAVERFARTFGVSYPLYVDGAHVTQQRLDARVIPTTLLIDARGVVRTVHVGPLDVPDLVAMTRIAR